MGEEKEPAGGYDATPLRPSSEPTYTIKITFHRATNLPASDLNTLSTDPYILAQLTTSQQPRHKVDPYLRFRSPTIQKNVNPEWNTSWTIAGVPQSGFHLEVRVFDEDPGDHDDRLGKAKIEQGRIDENWSMKEQECKIHKTGASIRAYAFRSCMAMTHKNVDVHAKLVMSIEVLGKTEKECGKAYTVNSFYRIHYSPMIGKMAGTKAKGHDGVERVVFQSNEIQLKGPVPNELYHRFVEFKSFVHGMFERRGLRGRILNKVLHKQHARVYIYDKQTEYGEFENGPSREMSEKFLDMVHYDQGGRIFTYVITLDGLFRFTETGKEFGIDLLSKHTMHSDVNIYIAWSGEFLVRRLSNPEKSASDPSQKTHPADKLPNGPPDSPPSHDPSHYELIIDNDSGTYRPQEKLLPVLHDFLEAQFPGLHVLTKSCTDKELDKIKSDQREAKKREGTGMIVGQGSMSDLGDGGSISSSDREDLEERAAAEGEDGGSGAAGGIARGVEFLENPSGAFKNLVPGHKEKVEREAAE